MPNPKRPSPTLGPRQPASSPLFTKRTHFPRQPTQDTTTYTIRHEPVTPTQSLPFRPSKRRKSRRIRLRFRHVSRIRMRNSFIPSMAQTVHYSLPKEKSL